MTAPPVVEAPVVEMPKIEMPKVEAPKLDFDFGSMMEATPKVEAPKIEAPKLEMPEIEMPKFEMPKFDALKFDPDRVSVSFDVTSTEVEPESLLQRRYTLTHNDVTRNLTLTVGTTFNDEQTSVWYTRLLRDEVLAEWREDGLHVFCQLSANEAWWIRWAAPFRAVVFRQKLPLVLDTLRYAERELLATYPELFDSPVYVNFGEASGPGDKEYWGDLRTAGSEETKSKRVVCADGAGLDPRIADNVRQTIKGPRGSGVIDIGGVVLEKSPTPPR